MKIKVLKARLPSYWYAGRIGEIFEVDPVIREYYDSVGFKYKIQGEPKYIQEGDFEIVKDIPEFDMKKEPWFISTPTPEISKLVQEWLFEKGFRWRNGNDQVGFTDTKFLMKSPFTFVEEGFCWTDDPKVNEIKLSFKTIIDSVEYPSLDNPVVETEQQRQIKALEETINKAAAQIAALKGEGK